MKRFLLILSIIFFIPVQAFTAPDFMSTANEILGVKNTCLELKINFSEANRLEYIYIDDERQGVVFTTGQTAEVLEYNNRCIKFRTVTKDINNKGYIYEAIYDINRFTGGCTVEVYHKAIGFGQKFDNMMFGIAQNYLCDTGTGTVKKVDTSVQKF